MNTEGFYKEVIYLIYLLWVLILKHWLLSFYSWLEPPKNMNSLNEIYATPNTSNYDYQQFTIKSDHLSVFTS
jgi:hypothetical protein